MHVTDRTSQTEQGATLIFPAVNQAAVAYITAAACRRERVVCAASVAFEDIATTSGGLHRLPSIYDDNFAHQLIELVRSHAIDQLFCPVASVYDFMRRFIATHGLAIQMIGESPIRQQVEQHHRLMAHASRLVPFTVLCGDGTVTLNLREVAGVVRQAALIYGESNDDKLAAMIGIAATAPQGDIVEIGSLMGRSAFVLLYLAWRYRIGPVLTVDPWGASDATQRQSPLAFQALVDEWDYDALSEGFYINMVPLRANDHAHLRMPSEQGFRQYLSGQDIQSSNGGTVSYTRKIALIHIDGNHDYDCVKQDCALWLPHMVPGAWLILDDYIWAHGDGPYRVGNDFLRDQAARVERAFVCGKALFIQLHH